MKKYPYNTIKSKGYFFYCFYLLFYYKYDILIKKLNGESYEHTDIWKIEVF